MKSSETDPTWQLSPRSQSFVLRIWREDLGEGGCEWRACVRHVTSGEISYVRSWRELADFLKTFDIDLSLDWDR